MGFIFSVTKDINSINGEEAQVIMSFELTKNSKPKNKPVLM
jgi:hypothetical protein